MNEQHLISIIIPTYNRAHLIGETLDSISNQTYQNWECIIVDDGSTDSTEQIVNAYVSRDSRFQYHQRPESYKSGGNGARNYGFEISTGEYINWLDSDDLISINKLEYQVSALLENKYDVILCEWLFFRNKDDINYSHSKKYKDFNSGIDLLNYMGSKSIYTPIHLYLIKSQIINKSGKWNESLKLNQDGEFMTRVLLYTNEIKFVANAYALYRTSTSNNTSSYTKEKLDDLIFSWNLISQHCSPFISRDRNIYVFSAKKRIFKYLKHDYPFIIKNFFFFKEVIYKLITLKIKTYQEFGKQLFKRKKG